MDLKSESSTLESEVFTPDNLANASEKTKFENNGVCSGVHVDEKLLVEAKADRVNGTECLNSPQTMVQLSPQGSVGSPSQAVKGYGLKKWRRIPREANKERGSNVDVSKILKRGLPNSQTNSRNPIILSSETQQNNEGGSVSHTNAVVRSPGVTVDGFATRVDSGLAADPIFAAGTDSENSEDRSSKSSTAASARMIRYEIPAVAGYTSDKNRLKGPSENNLGSSSVQWSQQRKSRVETSKKSRGEWVNMVKENSRSSMEFDSQSSNFLFMQGTNTVTSNGRQSGTSATYNQHYTEEVRTDFQKNLTEFDDVSQDYLAAGLSWGIKEVKSENYGLSADCDPLAESIITLQSAQEALEKEVQKFREIGREDALIFNDLALDSSLHSEVASVDPKVYEPSSSEQLQSDDCRQHFSNSLERLIISLKQNITHLESKIEEARFVLEVKEAKVIELEAKLNSSTSVQEETRGTVELQQGKYNKDTEIELEDLFKQNIEAEIEFLAISRTIQKLRIATVDQITYLEEQKTLASEKTPQMRNELEDAGKKARMLNTQTELENYCGEMVENVEILKLQKSVCKFTFCLFLELVLLIVILGVFILQLAPHYAEVVPT